MKTLQLSLTCLFAWNSLVEATKSHLLTLGDTVTVTCEFQCRKIIWFMEKPSAQPLMIMRVFADETVCYYDEKLRRKYSQGSRGQLVIRDVSDGELGIYHCIEPGNNLRVSEGIRLYNDANAPKDMSKATLTEEETNLIVIIVFTLLILVLFVAVVYLLVIKQKLSKKIPQYVNHHQISCELYCEPVRRAAPFEMNGLANLPPNPRTHHEYLQILPNTPLF